LVFYDSDDRLVLWNRMYDEFFADTATMRVPGVRFEEMLRGALACGMYPDAVGREAEWLAHRLAVHRQSNRVHDQRFTNGRGLRIEDRRTTDGGFIGIRVDITELKRREDELSVQNLRFDAALQQMSQGLVMFDRDDRLIVCNDRYACMYGLPPELTRPGTTRAQIIQHRIDIGVLGGTAEEYIRARVPVSVTGKPTDTIMELKDGRVVAIANRPASDGGWVSTHEDITERRRAEQERDRNRQFLDLVIENVPVSIVVRNASDQRYVLINRAGEELYGISREQMVGRTVHDVLTKEGADLVAGYDEDLLKSDPSAELVI